MKKLILLTIILFSVDQTYAGCGCSASRSSSSSRSSSTSARPVIPAAPKVNHLQNYNSLRDKILRLNLNRLVKNRRTVRQIQELAKRLDQATLVKYIKQL